MGARGARPFVLVALFAMVVAVPMAQAQEPGPDRVPIADWTPLPAATDITISAETQALRDELLGEHWDDPDHVSLYWTGVSSFVVAIRGHVLLFDAWEIIGAVTDYLPIGRQELADLRPEAILAGHGHFDHAGDLGYIAGRSGAAVVGSDEICTVAELGAQREGVGTDFACAVTGTASEPPPGTWQSFRLFADLAPIGVLQHVHSAPEPPGEDNPLNPFLPIMDPQPYLDHFADDPEELARFVAQQLEQDQGGTWMYHLMAGDFGLLIGDSAGPIWDAPDVTTALEDVAGCVDVLANAILGFDQPVSGLRDPVLYVAATQPRVFVPTHADAWAPVISAGQAQYEDELHAELARQDVTVEVDMLVDPDDYLVERAYRIDDPRWQTEPGIACPAVAATPDPENPLAHAPDADSELPATGFGLALLAAALLAAAALVARRPTR
jgi:hypothetical protein